MYAIIIGRMEEDLVLKCYSIVDILLLIRSMHHLVVFGGDCARFLKIIVILLRVGNHSTFESVLFSLYRVDAIIEKSVRG